jgi:hypothetical protein
MDESAISVLTQLLPSPCPLLPSRLDSNSMEERLEAELRVRIADHRKERLSLSSTTWDPEFSYILRWRRMNATA